MLCAVFGGIDGNGNPGPTHGNGYLRTAEVYDPASDSWAQVTSLTSGRRMFVAAAL